MLAILRKHRTILSAVVIMAMTWSTCVAAGFPCCSGECAAVCGIETSRQAAADHAAAGGCCSSARAQASSACRCQVGCPCCDSAAATHPPVEHGWSGVSASQDLIAACTCGPVQGNGPAIPGAVRSVGSAEPVVPSAAAILVAVVEPPGNHMACRGGWNGSPVAEFRPPVRLRCCVWTI